MSRIVNKMLVFSSLAIVSPVCRTNVDTKTMSRKEGTR